MLAGVASCMRIVSYNILDGGEGRADPIAEVIEAQRPDVVALLEADFEPTVQRIARRLSMDFIIAPGDGHASALLSRWPIRQTINHAALNPAIRRSFLEAVVIDPAGRDWSIGVLHLPPQASEQAEDERMQIIPLVLECFTELRQANRPHLICGDFNSNAPYQRIDPSQCTANTQQAWQSNGGKLPRRAIEAMTAAGYLDTFNALHDEKHEMSGSFTTQHPGQRVDYIFAWGVKPTEVKEAWVEQDRLAKYASDHFPIGVELSVPLVHGLVG